VLAVLLRECGGDFCHQGGGSIVVRVFCVAGKEVFDSGLAAVDFDSVDLGEGEKQ
jgi:hypothetical protein